MNTDFVLALRKEAPDFLPSLSTIEGHDLLTKLLWNIAQSNLLVCGRNPPRLSRNQFIDIVHTGRKSIQLLFQAAGVQVKLQIARKKSASSSRKRKAPAASNIPDNVSNVSDLSNISGLTNFTQANEEDMDPESLKGASKALAFSRMKGLPNIHVGMHLWEVARTYGSCRDVFTLLGEDKHR